MNSYQSNPILEFIRSQNLEIPNLQRVYQLWDAAKSGLVPFLYSSGASAWFGHSLFTSNVKIYLSYEEYNKISILFSSDSVRLATPSVLPGFYDYAAPPYSGPALQIQRYSSLMTFLGNLLGALDVMTVGLAYLYDFDLIRANFCSHPKQIEIDPLKTYFSTSVSLLSEAKKTNTIAGKSKPTGLINVFKNEGLLDINPSTSTTGCTWYENLKKQRHYFAHVGFPMLYVVNGEWQLPANARGEEPDSDLTTSIPIFSGQLFNDVRRFIGAIYDCAWRDFSSSLPQ